jgi:hypothetical protein
MSDTPAGTQGQLGHYEIRVQGRLGSRWAAWFDGMTLTASSDGTTVLEGPVVDQAALHGLLGKVNDLGLPLLSVTQVGPHPSVAATHPDHSHPDHSHPGD